MARMRIVVNVHLGGVCRNVNILIQWSVSKCLFFLFETYPFYIIIVFRGP